MKKLFLLSLFASFCAAVPVHAASRGDSIEKIESCEAILQEFMADPALAIPPEVFRKARGIVIANQARGGFVIGVKDGYAAMMVRRADNSWSLPVILSSGYSAELVGTNAVAQASAFLPKPCSTSDLAAAVRRCLDDAPPRRPLQAPGG